MTTISVDELVALGPQATIINAGDHQGSREIRGSLRYRPHDLLEPAHLALPVAHESTVVLYAEHGPSDKLGQIAEKMAHDGFADVRVLEGGLSEYERAGGPLQEASLEQVVPPMRPEEVQDLDRRL